MEQRQDCALRLLKGFCNYAFTVGPDFCHVDNRRMLASMRVRSQPIPKGTDLHDLLQSERYGGSLRNFARTVRRSWVRIHRLHLR